MSTPQHPWETPASGLGAISAAALASQIPVLNSERLRLRAPRIADFEVYLAATDARESREDLWLDFNQMVASWLLRGFGPWTIETQDRGEAVGFLPVDHEFGDPEPEIGWFVVPQARGRGIATAAADLALNSGLPPLGFTSVVSYIAADNVASLRVADRLGGTRLGPEAHPDPDVITHRYMLAEDRS